MINIAKGTKDVLPDESYKWQYVENIAREIASAYNFKEIRTPTFEHTELFLRGVGETTDVVTKEMYTFLDKGNRSITLKPEGTAGAVRSFIENGMSSMPSPVKLFYITPAFRYERPQAGRLREFHQVGLEVFGSSTPETDAEVITLASAFLSKLNVKSSLQINSIGCKTCRKSYNERLKDYFRPNLENMCETCRERFDKNPLRMLDCKEEKCKVFTQNAPSILDNLCSECDSHFSNVKNLLDGCGIEYEVNDKIVRGLDYYSRTVFEFVSNQIGAQGTICGGGRYDGLCEELGGSKTPAIGFGCGIERLLMLCGDSIPKPPTISLYIGGMDANSRAKAFTLLSGLRALNISCEGDLMCRSVKAQLKYANKIGVKYTLMIGANELETGVANLKCMENGTQVQVKLNVNEIKELL